MDEVTDAAPVETTTDQPAPDTEASTASVENFTDLDTNEPEGGFTPDWLQDRHKQMQGDYTRKTQAHAEAVKQHQEEIAFLEALRSDRDTQLAVLEELSALIGESDETGEEDAYQEETNPLEDRLAQLENERTAERAQALGREIAGHIDQLASDAKLDLDEEDLKAIFEHATSGEIGRQQTEAAFKTWHSREQARHEKWQKAYLASKQASAQVPNGASATDSPDLVNNRDERLKRFAAILQGQ